MGRTLPCSLAGAGVGFLVGFVAVRLAVYSAAAKKSPHAPGVAILAALLRNAKVPLTEKSIGDTPRELNSDEVIELARWMDMLDRI